MHVQCSLNEIRKYSMHSFSIVGNSAANKSNYFLLGVLCYHYIVSVKVNIYNFVPQISVRDL